MHRILAAIALLLLALPAGAAPPLTTWGQWDAKSPWVIFDSACTDSYNLDAAGLSPPGTGTQDVTASTGWDTFNERVNLVGNIGASPQVSGSADGFCDSAPWTIRFNYTTGVNETLYLGEFQMPADGFYIAVEAGTIVTNWDLDLLMLKPYDRDAGPLTWAALVTASTATTPVMLYFGPIAPYAFHTVLLQTENYPLWHEPALLKFDTNGAGAWAVKAALIPARSTAWSGQHRRPRR